MDLVETGDHYVLRADLPGLTDDDVNVQLEDNVLTISGERKTEHEEQEEGYYRLERAFGDSPGRSPFPTASTRTACRPTSTAACWRSDPQARTEEAPAGPDHARRAHRDTKTIESTDTGDPSQQPRPGPSAPPNSPNLPSRAPPEKRAADRGQAPPRSANAPQATMLHTRSRTRHSRPLRCEYADSASARSRFRTDTTASIGISNGRHSISMPRSA